jgi:hypothetical protein
MWKGALFHAGGETEHIGRHVFPAMFAVEFSHAAIIDIGQRDALCIGREAISKVMKQFSKGLLTRSAHFASTGPVDYERGASLRHG